MMQNVELSTKRRAAALQRRNAKMEEQTVGLADLRARMEKIEARLMPEPKLGSRGSPEKIKRE